MSPEQIAESILATRFPSTHPSAAFYQNAHTMIVDGIERALAEWAKGLGWSADPMILARLSIERDAVCDLLGIPYDADAAAALRDRLGRSEHGAGHDRSCVCWQRRHCGCYLWDRGCPEWAPIPPTEPDDDEGFLAGELNG